MKKMLFLSMLLILGACSKSPTENKIAQVSESSPYELEMRPLTATIGESVTSYDDSVVNFGTVQPKTKVSQSIAIVNSTSSAKPFSYVSNLTAPFSIKTTCGSSLAAKRSCSLTISGLITNEQNIDQGLYINGQELRVRVSTPEVVEVPVASISALPSSVSLGTVAQNSQQVVQITLTNQGTVASPIVVPALSNFSLTSSSCGTSLASKRSCILKYSFSSVGKSGSLSESLIIGSATIPMSVTIESAPPVLSVIDVQANESLISSNITAPANFSKNIVFTNNSGRAITNVSVASLSSNFNVTSSTCSGSIGAKRNCSVSISLLTSALQTAIYSTPVQLKFTEGLSAISNIEVNLTNASAISCDLSHLGNNIISAIGVNAVSGSYPNCVISSCQSNYENQETSCVPQSCDAVAHALSITGDKVVGCTVNSCENNYEVSNNSCQAIVCSVANSGIAHAQSVTGTLVSSCQVSTCEEGYSVNGNSCVADVITYSPAYSSYGACSALQACQGVGSKTRTLTSCTKFKNGQSQGIVDNSFCADFNQPSDLTQSCSSPAGEMTISLSDGFKQVSCTEGSSVQSFVSITCNSGYVSNESNTDCEYQATLTYPSSIGVARFLTASISSVTGSGASVTGSGVSATGSGVGSSSAIIAYSSSYGTTNNSAAASIDMMGTTIPYAASLDVAVTSCSMQGVYVLLNNGNCISNGNNFSFDVPRTDLLQESSVTIKANNAQKNVAVKKYSIKQITDISSGSADEIKSMVQFNGELYFSAQTTNTSSRLYKINSAGVITKISNIRPASFDYASELTVFNGELYFVAFNANQRTKLFKVNSSGVITQVSNINAAGTNDGVNRLKVYNNSLYFLASLSGSYSKIYKLSTSGVITRVSNTTQSTTLSDNANYFTIFNGELYFSAHNTSSQVKLFKLNTSDQITQVTNTNPSGSDLTSFLTASPTGLYFSSNISGTAYPKLFKLDLSGNLRQISNMNTSGSDEPRDMFVRGNNVYLSMKNSSGIAKHYRVDSSNNISLISNDYASSIVEWPSLHTLYNGEIFYTSYNYSTYESELYRIDADEKLYTIPGFSQIIYMSAYDGSLFIYGVRDGESNGKLYKLTVE